MSSKGKGKASTNNTNIKDKDRDLDGDEDGSPTNTNATDGKGGSGINRVNRACNNCRRMKMRCVGAEDPPCKRCRATGQDCVMEKPSRGTSSLDGVGDDRIKHLESQVTSIQNTLAELVSSIKSVATATSSSSNSATPPASSHPSHHPALGLSHGGHGHGHGGVYPGGGGTSLSPHGSGGGGGSGNYNSPAGSGGYTGLGMVQTLSNLQQQQQQSHNPYNTPQTHHQTLADIGTGGRPSLSQQHAGRSFLSQASGTGNHRNSAGGYPLGGSISGGIDPLGTSNTGTGSRSYSYGPGPSGSGSGRHGSGSGPGGSGGYPENGLWDESGFAIPTSMNYSGAGPATGSGSGQGSSHAQNIAGRDGDGGLQSGSASTSASASASAWELAFDATRNVSFEREGSSKPREMLSVNGGEGGGDGGTGTLTPNRRRGGSRSMNNSGNASPMGSGDEEDVDLGIQVVAPLGTLSSMAGLAEAAVERAAAERGGHTSGGVAGHKRPAAGPSGLGREQGDGSGGQGEDGRAVGGKRRKLNSDAGSNLSVPDDPVERAMVAANPPPIIVESHRSAKGKKTRRHQHAFPDVVSMGLTSEQEGRDLFDLYFSGCNPMLPIFDPQFDTWDSLRIRSPFCISAIIAVAARVRDGGGAVSEAQRACMEHARKIGLGTMWTPVARIEAVQATLVLASWTQNGWLPCGHAVRLGMDMEVNLAFMRLARTGMGAGKTPSELEEERDLVIQARCWFALYLMEHQMSYGTGRPAILREDACIAQCRRFLDHPLTSVNDARMVSTVEMLALRAPLHIVLTTSPEQPVNQETVIRLHQANADFDRWLAHWERVMVDRYHLPPDALNIQSLNAQRNYASLFINSQLLRGIKDSSDVKKMPADKRELAVKAMRNAQACLEVVLRAEHYRYHMRFAVHYTHVCAAFAASFLIRIARLFPQELNLRKTAKDVEELASLLESLPAGRYARSLRLLLRRARKSKYLPPPSVPTSPKSSAAHLPGNRLGQPGSSPKIPAFPPSEMSALSPNALIQSAMRSMGGPSYGGANMLQYPSPNSANLSGKNESPNSNPDSYDFDAAFMQDLLNRAGLSFSDNQLPLYMNGESLGAGPDNQVSAVGLENFFLPPDIDMRFLDLNAFNAANASQLGDHTSEGDIPPDTWW